MRGLTARQGEVLEYIRHFIATEGLPPSRRDLSHHFGWGSTNAADDYLLALEKKGAIRRIGGAARGIVVLAASDHTPHPIAHPGAIKACAT